MKNYLKLSLVALVLLITNVSVFAQRPDIDIENKGVTFIYVKVTEEIPSNVTNETIYDYIQLSDNRGNSARGREAIEIFESFVFRNRRVKWKGRSLVGNGNAYRPRIESIEIKDVPGSVNLLDPDSERRINDNGTPNNNGNDLEYRVLNASPNDTENYTINISIMIEGEERQFAIDPVMKLHP